jgi:hypothetical protein
VSEAVSQEAGDRRQKAEGRKAEGRRQKAGRQKAGGRRQEAGNRRQESFHLSFAISHFSFTESLE